ncbi:hypothetical protein DERF_013745 [Dermatophagoides farinae]|uniref:WW domain-containing protein n=1 Tax=Dermatophagoides farinae TaxID=6954 RepID=A0A922HQ44_DERFA|nr:hypothetical protein DERF_013745 [Dermatophagoides farinae]
MKSIQAILTHDFSYSSDNHLIVDLKKGDHLILIDKIDDKWWRFDPNHHNNSLSSASSSSTSSSKSLSSKVKGENNYLLVPSSHIILQQDYCRQEEEKNNDHQHTLSSSASSSSSLISKTEMLNDHHRHHHHHHNHSKMIISPTTTTMATKMSTIDMNRMKIVEHDDDDEERESDEAFESSSHESLLDAIDLQHYYNVGNSHDHNHQTSITTIGKIPAIKPRKYRNNNNDDKTPLYVNLPIYGMIENHNHNHHHNHNHNNNDDEMFKKSSPPSIFDANVRMNRWICDHWLEYYDENGRFFYYNSRDNITSWKPPRRTTITTKIDEHDFRQAEQQQKQQQQQQRQFDGRKIKNRNITTRPSSKEHYDSDSEIFLSNRVKKIVQNFNDDDLLLANLRRNASFNKSSKIIKRIKPTIINGNDNGNQTISSQMPPQLQPSSTLLDDHDEQQQQQQNPLIIIAKLLNQHPPNEWQPYIIHNDDDDDRTMTNNNIGYFLVDNSGKKVGDFFYNVFFLLKSI